MESRPTLLKYLKINRVSLSRMGLSVSSLIGSFSSLLNWSKDKDVRILMLGLDSAGKVSRIRRELVPGKSALTGGLWLRTDNNIVQATGNHPSLLRSIHSNWSTLKIGEVVSTIPSEQTPRRSS